MDLLLLFDYFGTAAFAASGIMAAQNKDIDFIGAVFIAVVTAMGGGDKGYYFRNRIFYL